MIPTEISIFVCKKCGEAMTVPLEDGYGEEYCTNPECGATIKRSRDSIGQRGVDWVSIAAYDIDREWGGPEEGGWYYDTGERVDETLRSFRIRDLEWSDPQTKEAEDYMKFLKEHNDYKNCRVRVYVEVIAPKEFPNVTPRYC